MEQRRIFGIRWVCELRNYIINYNFSLNISPTLGGSYCWQTYKLAPSRINICWSVFDSSEEA